MKKYTRQIIVFAVILLIVIVAKENSVYAATANIDIPSQNVSKGEEVKVAIHVTSDGSIGTFDLRITYNSSVLEYVSGADNGGSGVLQLLNADLNQEQPITKELTFKAIDEGNSEIAVQAASSSVLDMGAAPMEIAGGTGSVTVGGAEKGSSDNALSSLTVNGVDGEKNTIELSLTPAFSPETLEYRTEVGETITKLSISAIASDPAANTKISGTKLDPGENLTTITVTSTSGEIREYKIYTVKNEASEEPQDSEVEEFPLPEDLSPVFSGKTGKYIIQNFDTVGIPEGFVASGYAYEDRQITALIKNQGDIVLMCLADDEAGTNSALFVYNASTDSFSLYNQYVATEKSYIMLTPDADTEIPEEYTETVVQINGVDTMAWQAQQAGFYLIYAANQNGEKGFYIYDKEEETFSRYYGSKPSVDSELQSKYDKLKKKSADDDFVKLELIIGFSVLCLILIIYASVLLFKLKKLTPDEENDLEEHPDVSANSQKESDQNLKLDMAIQANEVRTGTLADDVATILDGDQEKQIQQEAEDSGIIRESEEKAEDSQNQEEIKKPSEESVVKNENTVEKSDSDKEKQEDDLGIVFVDLEAPDKK